jgi:glycosyltransferase involved in cell wall biosynthesis
MRNFSVNKKRSILFVSQSFYPGVGGVSTLLLNLSHYLAKLNYKIYAIHFEISNHLTVSETLGYPIREYIISRSEIPKKVFQGYASFKEEIYQHLHGLKSFKYQKIEDVPGYKDFVFCSELFSKHILNVISDNNIDLVHFQDYQVMLGLSAIPLDMPSIFSLHAPLIDNINKTIASWLVRYGNKANKMIFSIPQNSEIAIKYGLRPEKSIVLPPIIDKDIMSGVAELPNVFRQIPQWATVVTCVQRFDSKSNQIQLIKAFSKISNKYQNSYLVFIGGRSFTDSISNIRKNYFLEAQSLVRNLNLENKIIFTGNIDYTNLSQIYRQSDVIVMLSKMECFGLAITEAMFHSKPVLVTDVGGLAFQVKNGVNGYTVKPGDINSTAKLLGRLIDSKKLRIKMGNESKRIFRENFDPEKIIRDYHRLYQSLLFPTILGDPLNYDYLYNLLR